MILDAELLFDSAASISGATGGASTNVIDLVNARDMEIGDAEGKTPKIMCLVTTAFATSNAATLNVQAQGSTDNITYTTYAESGAVAAAALTAGRYVLAIDWPRPNPGAALPRYLRLNYAIGTGAFTAGAVTAALVLGRDDIVAYPPGTVVAN